MVHVLGFCCVRFGSVHDGLAGHGITNQPRVAKRIGFFSMKKTYSRNTHGQSLYLDSTLFHSNSNMINLLFSFENSRPCRDLNLRPPQYQADMLPTELSWLG